MFELVIARLFPCAANTNILCVKKQFLDQIKVKDISQLINGMLNFFQKLLKCFNGTKILTSVIVLLSFYVFPVILVLYLNNLEFLISSLSDLSL